MTAVAIGRRWLRGQRLKGAPAAMAAARYAVSRRSSGGERLMGIELEFGARTRGARLKQGWS